MTDSPCYNVVCTGEYIDGHQPDSAQQAFAQLFKLSPEKATAFLASKRVLKKDLPEAKANAYQRKLREIGVVAILEPVAAAAEDAFTGLSLEPMDKPASEVEANIEQAENDNIHEPPEQYISGEIRKPTSMETDVPDEQYVPSDSLNLVAIGAAAAAAFAGALIWKFIVVVFNYELGIVAWGIGGLVGYAALALGSRGQLCGIVCGVLALVSILGGKYMAVGSFQVEAIDMFASELVGDEFNTVSEEQQQIAAYYVDNVSSDDEMRLFMVEYGYTEAYEPDEVSNQEMTDFKEFVAPMLEGMADGEFDVGNWIRESFEKEMENTSKWQLMQDNFGFIDFVFLFLGVGTAFKLGSGGSDE